jgi:hypothetical protein
MMSRVLRKTLFSRPITSILANHTTHISSSLRSFVNIRTMNTLQERSTIYKAFKKGGPALGGWQVRLLIVLSFLLILTLFDRCCQEQTILVQLPVLASIGSVLTANTATSMVSTLHQGIATSTLMTNRRRDARSRHRHSSRRCQSHCSYTRQ